MLKKLTNRVYYKEYVQKGDRPVLGLIAGDKYSLVIDGGNSKEHANEFLKEIKSLNIAPVKYLVLTHWHWDHVFGISTIGAINIVHKKSDEKLKWMKTLKWTDDAIRERVLLGEEIEFCEEHMKIEHPNNNREIQIPESDIVFDSTIEIDLGGVTVCCEHIETDHSDDCVIVSIKDDRVTFIGDAMYNDMYNGNYSYSREKLYPFLDRLLEIKSNYYIPSHHNMYTLDEFKDYSGYIREVGDIVHNKTIKKEAIKEYEFVKGRCGTDNELNDIIAFVEENNKRK
ncbi:MAG: MBL fold metallo-hydrolase [Clostridium sp.]